MTATVLLRDSALSKVNIARYIFTNNQKSEG